MKYGIDINNDEILNIISEGLKRRGNFIVNLTQKENINYGKKLLKKALIANVASVDVYFSIDFKSGNENLEILYSEYNDSKIRAENLKKTLDKKFENVLCKKGDYLYLIKNIDAPVICLRIPSIYEQKFQNINFDQIINILDKGE